MKYFITGDAGFIGTYFKSRLISEGFAVKGIDINASGSDPYSMKINILDQDRVLPAMRDCEIILHLAAKHHEFTVGPQQGIPVSTEDYHETNVEGTKVLLDTALKLKISNFIFFSSVAVYGESCDFRDESAPFNANNHYGISKVQAEQAVREWVSKKPGNRALIIRPVVVFGRNNWGNVYQLIDHINRNRYIQVGSGKNRKSMAYLENLYDSVVFAWENMSESLEIYNYSDYPILSSKEITDIIYKLLGKKKPKLKIPYPLAYLGGKAFDVMGRIRKKEFGLSSSKVKKFCSSTACHAQKIREKGFEQKYSLEYGFEQMISWYKGLGD